MSDTKKELSQSKPSRINTQLKDAIQATDLSSSLAKSSAESDQSKSLSTNVAEHLLHLMLESTKTEVSPKTVHAACACATQIIQLMKVNIEMKRAGM